MIEGICWFETWYNILKNKRNHNVITVFKERKDYRMQVDVEVQVSGEVVC